VNQDAEYHEAGGPGARQVLERDVPRRTTGGSGAG